MLSIKRRPRGAIVSIAACAAAMLLFAAPASAATDVYPAGEGAFNGDAEGWQVTENTCNIPLAGLCTATGAHDPGSGNPAGSLAAQTSILLNLGGLFQSTVAFESPDFVVSEDGAPTVHLDRHFDPSVSLLSLQPTADYTVALIDRGTETPSTLVEETLGEDDTAFVGKDAAATVTEGGTYALAIEVLTGSEQVGLAVLGDATARFDNVALSVETPDPDPPVDPPTDPGDDGNDGNDGNDDSSSKSTKNSSSSDQETSRQGTTTGVVQNGRRVLVRLSCPVRARKSCRITAQGKLAGKSVTKRRTVKVGKGKSRVVALRVKPRFREVVAERKRLQILQKVKTGKRTRTFTRSRPLIQR